MSRKIYKFNMGKYVTILLAVFLDVTLCQESYMGMFRPATDVIVANDLVYKERVPFGYTYAKYGRVFNCKITYVSVQDRYGALTGETPTIQVIRGGLQKTYIVLKLTSYNQPIATNVRIGCANKRKPNKNKNIPVEDVTDIEDDEELKNKDGTTTEGSAEDGTTQVGDAGDVTTEAGEATDGEATTAEVSASEAAETETTTAAAATTTAAAA